MSYAYQWKRGGVNISGATANTYTLVTADLGATITATVTATNAAGSASATAAGVGPVTAGSSTALQAQAGSFAFAGQSATLTAPAGGGALSIQAQPGSFAVSGESMEVVVGYLTQAGVGAFALAGQSATLTVAVPSSYTGPGEVAGWGTAYAYYGLRAYTAAKIGSPCIDVASNLNGAALNLTTVNIGSDGYADLSGIGFSPIYVHKLYDQAGTQHLFSQDNRSKLLPGVLGGKPAMEFISACRYTSAVAATALAQPITVGAIVDINGGAVLTDGTNLFLPFLRAFAEAQHNFGSSVGYTAVSIAAGTFFSLASKAHGATSSMAVNGTVTNAGSSPGTNGISGTNMLTIGSTDSGTIVFSGRLFEAIIKAGAVLPADQTALSVNQHAIGTGWT